MCVSVCVCVCFCLCVCIYIYILCVWVSVRLCPAACLSGIGQETDMLLMSVFSIISTQFCLSHSRFCTCWHFQSVVEYTLEEVE